MKRMLVLFCFHGQGDTQSNASQFYLQYIHGATYTEIIANYTGYRITLPTYVSPLVFSLMRSQFKKGGIRARAMLIAT